MHIKLDLVLGRVRLGQGLMKRHKLIMRRFTCFKKVSNVKKMLYQSLLANRVHGVDVMNGVFNFLLVKIGYTWVRHVMQHIIIYDILLCLLPSHFIFNFKFCCWQGVTTIGVNVSYH